MEFDLEATVHLRDASSVGKVIRAVIDPVRREIVDLIVREQKGLFEARDKVVPVSAVETAIKGDVRLHLSQAELEKLPDYVETNYIPVPPQWFIPAPFPPGGLLWPAGTAATVFTEEEVRNIPPGTVTIAEGMDVACRDGRVGSVDEVVVDPQTRGVRGFLVRRGVILTHAVYVPIDWVAEVTSEAVVLDRTKAEIEQLKEQATGRD